MKFQCPRCGGKIVHDMNRPIPASRDCTRTDFLLASRCETCNWRHWACGKDMYAAGICLQEAIDAERKARLQYAQQPGLVFARQTDELERMIRVNQMLLDEVANQAKSTSKALFRGGCCYAEIHNDPKSPEWHAAKFNEYVAYKPGDRVEVCFLCSDKTDPQKWEPGIVLESPDDVGERFAAYTNVSFQPHDYLGTAVMSGLFPPEFIRRPLEKEES